MFGIALARFERELIAERTTAKSSSARARRAAPDPPVRWPLLGHGLREIAAVAERIANALAGPAAAVAKADRVALKRERPEDLDAHEVHLLGVEATRHGTLPFLHCFYYQTLAAMPNPTL